MKSTIKLNSDGKIGYITATSNVSLSSVTVNEYFTEYGSTTIPAWLDASAI
ncbi:MAG: hypothetical protein WCR67_02150 [Bacilli bacterium]